MKKLLLLFTTLLLISCSSDDDTGNNDNTNGDKTVLIKRITEYFNNEYYSQSSTTDVYVADYVYDGNKIVSIKEYLNDNLRYTYNFTYTNNLISQYNSIDESNDQYSSSTFFRYDNNNRLTEYIYNGYSESSENFEYNGNTVRILQSKYGYCTDIVLSNNQITSITEYYDDCKTVEFTANGTYDNNKNAFSNIEGYNWYFQYDYTLSQNTEYLAGINNVTSDGEWNWAYDYNENGYPRNVTVTEDGSLVATLTIEYY